MTNIRCCVVDDEPLAAQLIASYVEKTPFMDLVGVFSSAQDAIKTILDENVDIVFLDIEMPQLNGVEFARVVPANCRVVFTTAYDAYAMQGYKVNALDYLLKPISYEDFVGAANKALQWCELNSQANVEIDRREYIMVKSEYKLVQVPIKDIVYIEGLKDYVKIYLENEQKSIMTLMSMKALEKYLPTSKFLRVHRSFIVNTTKIKVVERNRIVFGNQYIPVSESYKQAFNDYVNSVSVSLQAVGNDE